MKLVKDFVKNMKEFLIYLLKLGYKQLFINVIILFSLIMLALLVYIPVEIVRDLIREFITIFYVGSDKFISIYNFIFSLISFVMFVILFMYFFNKRVELVDYNEEENANVKQNKNVSEKINREDDLELPIKKVN